ncbi:MAG TPA: hypothetical protein VIJ86_02315 [Acidimicrobiales bacterium]
MTGAKKITKAANDAVTHAKNAAVAAKGRAKAITGKTPSDCKIEMTGELESVRGKVKQVGQKIKEFLDD